jgi:uncharacterized protein
MATSYKTPGVYIEEISKLPPSVAQVETAIPAFIGYTEMAKKDNDETALILVPTRIRSLEEYKSIFGEAPKPSTLEVTGKFEGDVYNPISAKINFDYYLYYSLELFFTNGGGTCYIVSVGDYTATVAYDDLKDGLDTLKQYDEPTLIVFPDAIKLSDTEHGTLMADALSQCNDLKDRFVIMDVYGGDEVSVKSAGSNYTVVNAFRGKVSSNYLKYGAAYYPFLKSLVVTSYTFEDIDFFDNSATPITDLKDLDDSTATGASFDTVIGSVNDAVEVRDSIITALDIETFKTDYAGAYGSGSLSKTKLKNAGVELRDMAATIIDLLDPGATTPVPDTSSLYTTIDDYIKVDDPKKELQTIVELLVAYDFKYDSTAGFEIFTYKKTGGIYNVLTTTFDGTSYTDAPDYKLDELVLANLSDIYTGLTTQAAKFSAAKLYFDALYSRVVKILEEIYDAADSHVDNAALSLKNTTVYQKVMAKIKDTAVELPPCGAIAGIYTAVDEDRGVWKAPANVVIGGIIGPSVKIDDKDQEDMNVDTTSGKSVNAIRAFTGKGTLVWGARTLSGNDNEWRYIPVRRFFNMVEESVKKATDWVVFEPNDANTWVRVRAMIENFLTTLWRQGALAGSKPEQAFFVKVGLNETMTSLDILEGRMNIEIGMAAVRPAEFIILKFSHKLQES